MENKQIAPELSNFIQSREQEILAIAKSNTEDIVKRELSLLDFELLLSANLSESEEKELTDKAKVLRKESWEELLQQFDGDYDKINNFLNDF